MTVCDVETSLWLSLEVFTMSIAIIIQGTSGSGKTTLARSIAIGRRTSYLEYDYFSFAIQPYRPDGTEHFELGNSHLWCCFRNIVDTGKDLVLEGALVSHDKRINKFDLNGYISYLEKNGYSIVRIMLTCSFDVAYDRMSPRGKWDGHTSIVPKETYNQIEKALKDSVPSSVLVLDTTNISIDAVAKEVNRLISNIST